MTDWTIETVIVALSLSLISRRLKL